MDFAAIVDFELWGNAGMKYAIMLGTFVGLIIVFKIFTSIILRKLRKASERTETDVDNFIISLIKQIKPPFYFMVAFYIAVQFLELHPVVGQVIYGAFLIIIVIQIVSTLQRIVDYVIRLKLLGSGDEDDQDKEAIIRLAGKLSKAALWIFGGLLVLSNLGINVTSLIAGLGIGGVAIAFAVKGVLEDIFASFSIFVDKPFKIGDFVSVSDTKMGTVEKIGIKSTRLRTKEGHELVVANKTLTDEMLMNYRRKGERKVTIALGVTYETSLEKLKKIPDIIKGIIEASEHTTLTRVIFKDYGASSLDFEVVFAINITKDVNWFMVKSEINYAIFKAFQDEGIDFAYPTQTLHIHKNQNIQQ